MTDKKKGTFPPTALALVGAVTTIGGAALMTTSDSFAIQDVMQPLTVFFVGIIMSSVAIVLRNKQKRNATKELENGK